MAPTSEHDSWPALHDVRARYRQAGEPACADRRRSQQVGSPIWSTQVIFSYLSEINIFFRPDYTWINGEMCPEVESFDLQTEEWSSEAPFPLIPVGRGTNIPYGNSFLSIGGFGQGRDVDYIYTVRNHFLGSIIIW